MHRIIWTLISCLVAATAHAQGSEETPIEAARRWNDALSGHQVDRLASLYGERVGALSIVTGSADETKRLLSQVKRVIRTNYSNPPTHGGALVTMVLSTPALKALWEEELAAMRNRIRAMREGLVQGLKDLGVAQDMSFVTRQKGMFSYSGLTEKQVDRLREEHGIYAVGTGRICIAALNNKNLPRVSQAIASVIKP